MENQDLHIGDGGLKPGGLATFGWWAFAADIAQWPAMPPGPALYAEAVELQGDFVMKPGKGFHRLETELEMSELSASAQGEMNRLSTDHRYAILQCGRPAELMGWLELCRNRKMAVLVPDLEGSMRLLGYDGLPAKIVAYSLIGGRKTSDLNAVEATLYAPGHIVLSYNGTIPQAPELPENAIVDEFENYIVDEDGNFLIYE